MTSITDESMLNMKDVKAKFYFKDQTVLNVSSKEGKYNNQTLDMKFENKVIMDLSLIHI